MNEDFIPDVLLNDACLLDHLEELLAGTLVVGPVRVNYIDQRSAILYVLDGIALEHVVAGEVDHVELNVVVVAHRLSLNIARRKQEKCLVRGHLLENNLTDACLTRSENFSKEKSVIKEILVVECLISKKLTWAFP